MIKTEITEKFQDPNTGETVTRAKIPENLLKEIDKPIQANATAANNFLGLSRQIMALEMKAKDEFLKASDAEKEIGKIIIKTRDKLGLDSGWVYNIGLKVMEKRDPPPETRIMESAGVKP